MHFEKIFLINLKFKQDRLERFLKQYPKDTLGNVEIVQAVHGDTVLHPNWWKSGNGAWGCYRSHMQILEKCYNENVESYLVFEDDAIFRPEFDKLLSEFMDNVPDDWQQLYLGGQLIHEIKHPPIRINPHVLMPYNVNRTHCFALNKRSYSQIYKHLYNVPFYAHEHIDHHLGRLHETGKFCVYCPNKWLVGQDADRSNISGKENPVMWWSDPEAISRPHWLYDTPLCVLLKCTNEIADTLQNKGWHQGNWKNENGLDHGVCAAISSHEPEKLLTKWYDWIRREVIRDNLTIPTLYHPAITEELCKQMTFAKFITIDVITEEEAKNKLKFALEEYKVP